MHSLHIRQSTRSVMSTQGIPRNSNARYLNKYNNAQPAYKTEYSRCYINAGFPSRADTEVHKNIIKRRGHLKCARTEHQTYIKRWVPPGSKRRGQKIRHSKRQTTITNAEHYQIISNNAYQIVEIITEISDANAI